MDDKATTHQVYHIHIAGSQYTGLSPVPTRSQRCMHVTGPRRAARASTPSGRVPSHTLVSRSRSYS